MILKFKSLEYTHDLKMIGSAKSMEDFKSFIKSFDRQIFHLIRELTIETSPIFKKINTTNLLFLSSEQII